MSEPLRACPFWSRVAQVNGITLALCSTEDLERQRERGFNAPEGWYRQPVCEVLVEWTSGWSAQKTPAILAKGDNLKLEPMRRTFPGGWIIATLVTDRDYDTAWAKALEWAAQQ